MTQPTPSLGSAVDDTLARVVDVEIPAPPAPIEVRTSRHDGAITIVTDGATVTVELSDPIRLGAEQLAEELTSAINEALAEAHEQAFAAVEGAASPSELRDELGSLGKELSAAYEAELQALDARIEQVANR